MSDNNLYEKEKRGQNTFLLILLTVALTIGLVLALFTNYKQEKLVCSKSDNICYLQKTNYANIKTKKILLKYSDIKYPMYVPKSVAGNMYAKGYTYYILTFYTQNKKNIRIFTTDYYEKDDVKNAVDKLKDLVRNNEDIFEYNRE